MDVKTVVCAHCGSDDWIKKGMNKAGTARVLLCKECGKRFAGPLNLDDVNPSPSKSVQGGPKVAPTIMVEVNGNRMPLPCDLEKYIEITQQQGNMLICVSPSLYRVEFPARATKG